MLGGRHGQEAANLALGLARLFLYRYVPMTVEYRGQHRSVCLSRLHPMLSGPLGDETMMTTAELAGNALGSFLAEDFKRTFGPIRGTPCW